MITYSDADKNLLIEMNYSNARYTLGYLANGQLQAGQPDYEGSQYTAICKDNKIKIEAVMPGLVQDVYSEYNLVSPNKLVYKRYFPDGTNILVCEMDRP